jgi:hypothetical protein
LSKQLLTYCGLYSKALLRGSQLRAFRNAIPPHAFASRKAYLTQAFEQGKYLKNPNAPKEGTPTPNPMTDPDMMEGMMEGMKKQVSNMVLSLVSDCLGQALSPLLRNLFNCSFSQTPFSLDASFQVYASKWCGHP